MSTPKKSAEYRWMVGIQVFAVFLTFGSIVFRVFYRDIYLPGWDMLGAANGQYLLIEKGIFGAVLEAFRNSRNFFYWNQTNSVVFSILPGAFSILWHQEMWSSIFDFFSFTLTLFCLFKATGLTKENSWIILLACACSSAILSFSIEGYPYITGFLPHILALLLVTNEKIRKNIWFTAALGAATCELSMHLYEAGRTFFMVFFAYALLDRKISMRVRLVWIAVACLSLYFFVGFSQVKSPQHYTSVVSLPQLLIPVLLGIFRKTFVECYVDLPALFVLGILALIFIKQDKKPLLLIYLGQWLLMMFLYNYGPAEYRPRRVLVLQFYHVLFIGLAAREYSSRLFRNDRLTIAGSVLCGTLSMGALWQLIHLWNFAQTPITKRNYPLPYAHSPADFYIHPRAIDWTDKIEDSVRYSNRKIILLYSYAAFPENTTDPLALLERLYLRLGHRRFKDRVFIFSNMPSRYSHVPIQQEAELEKWLQNLSPQDPWVVYKYNGTESAGFTEESNHVLVTLEKNFHLTDCVSFDHSWSCFRISAVLPRTSSASLE